MKANQILLTLPLIILVLSGSSGHAIKEVQPMLIQELSQNAKNNRQVRSLSTQNTTASFQSGPNDSQELENFLDPYLAEQMDTYQP